MRVIPEEELEMRRQQRAKLMHDLKQSVAVLDYQKALTDAVVKLAVYGGRENMLKYADETLRPFRGCGNE